MAPSPTRTQDESTQQHLPRQRRLPMHRPAVTRIPLSRIVIASFAVVACAAGTVTVITTSGCDQNGAPVPEWVPRPVDHIPYPQHPFLSPNGTNNMHDDAYMSDTYEVSGPLPDGAEVTLKKFADNINTCVTITFDRQGRMLTTNVSILDVSLLLLDPETLDVLATYPLPPRDPSDPLFPYNDTSGATYFVMDNLDRVILTDSNNAIQVVAYSDDKNAFELVQRYDLSDVVVPMDAPARDHVQMAIPDWKGQYLWFTTRYGVVGTLCIASGNVQSTVLAGEEIENSFAVAEDGAYILTDHAMYRFEVNGDGAPVQVWAHPYDRGSHVKPSNFNQGSGTTPQIFGDLVAISNNADPRMDILFLKRSTGETVSSIPVFDDGRSTTENALPGLVRGGPNGKEYSVIVDNNYGIERNKLLTTEGCWTDHAGTLVRIDLVPDARGDYHATQVWRSPEKSSQLLPKISLTDGILYVYTYKWLTDEETYDWYLTGIDFFTGKTLFSIPTGKGLDYTNFGQPLILGPDGHTAYLGTMAGLVRVRNP